MNPMEFRSKKEIEKAIRQSITKDIRRAIKALLRLYEYQMESEKELGISKTKNGVGFNVIDAKMFTNFCNIINNRKYLSLRQRELLFKRIGKYAGQLTRQAISKNLYVKEGKVWKVNYAAQRNAVATN